MNLIRLTLGLVLVALAALCQILCVAWGAPFDFTLATLIAAAFFFSFSELCILALWGAVLLQWSPGLRIELVLLVAIPIIICGLRLLFPWKGWFSFFLAGLLGVSGFNFVTAGTVVLRTWGLFAGDLFMAMIYGTFMFLLFQALYERKQPFSLR